MRSDDPWPPCTTGTRAACAERGKGSRNNSRSEAPWARAMWQVQWRSAWRGPRFSSTIPAAMFIRGHDVVLCTGGLCSPSRITRKKSDDRCGTRPRWLRRVSRLRSSTLAPASRRHLYTRAAQQSTPAGAGADGDRTARSRRRRAGTRTPRTILPRIGGCFPRHAHGWRRTAATVTPTASSKSSVAVAKIESPVPRRVASPKI